MNSTNVLSFCLCQCIQ